MSDYLSRIRQKLKLKPLLKAGKRFNNQRILLLLLAPLLVALGLGGWRVLAAPIAQAAPSPSAASSSLAAPAPANASTCSAAAPGVVSASVPSPASASSTSPSTSAQWVLVPDTLPVPAFPGDIPPLPAAHSAQDSGFHPDLVLKTNVQDGVVTLTCRNPATGKTEQIVGKAGRDTVFTLADPQSVGLPTVPVQSVPAGALVVSRDPATGATGYGRVTGTIQRPADALVTVSVSDASTHQTEQITCTPEHPLYVSGQGWVEAGSLGVGTSIVTRAGPPAVVQGVSWQRSEGSRPFTVYNLTVQDDHTYFAGTLDGGLWAHNACEGEFSIRDWTGYPEGAPRPTGPFRLLEGDEYQAALQAKNAANKALHDAYPDFDGFDIHEWHPVKFGGSPTDIANKYPLSRQDHIPFTTFWNNLMRNLTR